MAFMYVDIYIRVWIYKCIMYRCTSSAVATTAIYLVRHAKRVHPRVYGLIDVVGSMLRRVAAHLAVGSHVTLSLIEDRKTVKPTNNNCFISTRMDNTTHHTHEMSSCIVTRMVFTIFKIWLLWASRHVNVVTIDTWLNVKVVFVYHKYIYELKGYWIFFYKNCLS